MVYIEIKLVSIKNILIKCNQCLSNFYVALKRLNSTQHCDQVTDVDSSVSGCNLQI